MAEIAENQAGALDDPADAGTGPAGVVKRWTMELDLATKSEESWRKSARDVNARYRDEKLDGAGYASGSRYETGNRFNILYSNVQTICPALYNQTPKPDVRRRYRDPDETGKVIADILERGLSYTMDEYDFDRFMRLAVKDCQLTGRGVTRIKYEGILEKKEDDEGEEYEEKVYDEVSWQHVNWADFRIGPGRTWEEVEWVAFKHTLTRDELAAKFPKTHHDVQMDYTPQGLDDAQGDPIIDTFRRAVVWEVWSLADKEVIYIAPSLAERPLKVEDDPLGLENFFPIPRPLMAIETTDTLIPIEPFRIYADQADELDEVTKRISGIIRTCKVRGIYDSTVTEMSTLMDSGENVMVPATDVLPLMQSGGLEKAIWLWPVERIAGVLIHLYNQREAIKTTIYEITGIADIMRGSSAASETLGAQQLKAQFGTMRLDDMRREVQRYARDLVRMVAEVMAEHFSVDTMAIMTEVQLPTNEQKQQAMAQAQQMQQQGQQLPKKFAEGMALPTWEEALQVLRDDKQRSYRIDIETDSTVAGDQAADQKAITELLTGIASFIQNAGPAVGAGYLPLEAAKSLLMTSVRRFKMGREVEDALDMIGEEEGEEEQPDPAMVQLQDQMQQLQPILQQLQQENEQLKADKSTEAQRTQMDGEKAAAEIELKRGDQSLKAQEFELKASQPVVTPQEQWEYDMQMEREKMAFDAEQKALDRQAEAEQKALDREANIAKAIIAKSDNENNIDSALSDLHANKSLTYNDDGSISGYETTDIESTISRIKDVISNQSNADRGGMEQALVNIAAMQAQTGELIVSSNDRLAAAITAPKRAIYENGRPVGIETV